MKKKEKKRKKDKNIIEIDRKVWDAMNYKQVVCNHSLINNYTERCSICHKSITNIEFERFLKKKKKEGG